MKEFLEILCGLLGIPFTSESDARAQLSGATARLSTLQRDVLALTGKTDLPSAIGVLSAWKLSHETLSTLRTELEQQKKETAKASAAGKIAKAVAELRLEPSKVPFAEQLSHDPGLLDAFLATLVPLGEPAAAGDSATGTATTSGVTPPARTGANPSGPKKGTGKLSDADRKIFKNQGLDDAAIAAIEAEGV